MEGGVVGPSLIKYMYKLPIIKRKEYSSCKLDFYYMGYHVAFKQEISYFTVEL